MAEKGVIAELVYLIGAQVKGFTDGMSQASKGLAKFGNKIQANSKQLQTIGATAGIAGAAVAAGLGLAVKSAATFEKSFLTVVKTVDEAETNIVELSAGLRNMAKEIPINVNELNKLASIAGQLGVKGADNILEFTKIVGMMGTATNVSSEEAALALARIANITQLPIEQISNLASTVVGLGNTFAAQESEIIEFQLRLAGAGNTIGLTNADIAGLSTALAAVGVNAEAGGSALSRVMLDIQTAVGAGGEKLEQFAAIAGQSAEGFAKSFKEAPGAAIRAFVSGLGDIEASGIDVSSTLKDMGLGSLRVKDSLLRLKGAGGLLNKTMAKAAEEFRDNTALQEEFERAAGGTTAQLQLLFNNLNDVAITVGNVLLPILNDLLQKVLIPVVSKFGEWVEDHPALLATVVALAGAFAGLMIPLGALLVLLPGIVTLFTSFGPVVAVVTAGFTALLPLLTPILTALGALALVGVALFAAWKLIAPQWEGIKSVFVAFGIFIKDVFIATVLNPMAAQWEFITTAIAGFVGGLFDGLREMFGDFQVNWEDVWAFVIGIIETFKEDAIKIIDLIKVPFILLDDLVKERFGGWGEFFKVVGTAVGLSISDMVEGVVVTIKWMLDQTLILLDNWVAGVDIIIDTVNAIAEFFGKEGGVLPKIGTAYEVLKERISAAVKETKDQVVAKFNEIVAKGKELTEETKKIDITTTLEEQQKKFNAIVESYGDDTQKMIDATVLMRKKVLEEWDKFADGVGRQVGRLSANLKEFTEAQQVNLSQLLKDAKFFLSFTAEEFEALSDASKARFAKITVAINAWHENLVDKMKNAALIVEIQTERVNEALGGMKKSWKDLTRVIIAGAAAMRGAFTVVSSAYDPLADRSEAFAEQLKEVFSGVSDTLEGTGVTLSGFQSKLFAFVRAKAWEVFGQKAEQFRKNIDAMEDEARRFPLIRLNKSWQEQLKFMKNALLEFNSNGRESFGFFQKILENMGIELLGSQEALEKFLEFLKGAAAEASDLQSQLGDGGSNGGGGGGDVLASAAAAASSAAAAGGDGGGGFIPALLTRINESIMAFREDARMLAEIFIGKWDILISEVGLGFTEVEGQLFRLAEGNMANWSIQHGNSELLIDTLNSGFSQMAKATAINNTTNNNIPVTVNGGNSGAGEIADRVIEEINFRLIR